MVPPQTPRLEGSNTEQSSVAGVSSKGGGGKRGTSLAEQPTHTRPPSDQNPIRFYRGPDLASLPYEHTSLKSVLRIRTPLPSRRGRGPG